MKRILLVYYSQSGDVAEAAEAFVRPLRTAGAEVVVGQIQSTVQYPYPWRTLGRLFDVFPECLLGLPPAIQPMAIGPDERFDLVVLAYPVWFLAPSLPVQGFLQSQYAKVLEGTKVITLCVNRKMWHSASEMCKERLRKLNAFHIDNVVVTYKGPPLATFVTILRSLLMGKRDGLWGVFPSARVGREEVARLERLGAVVARQLDTLDTAPGSPLLKGLGAAEVIERYVVPELVAWSMYRRWARLVLVAGRLGRWARRAAIYVFILFVFAAVLVGLPLAIVLAPFVHPFVRRSVVRYMGRLAEPSGQ